MTYRAAFAAKNTLINNKGTWKILKIFHTFARREGSGGVEFSTPFFLTGSIIFYKYYRGICLLCYVEAIKALEGLKPCTIRCNKQG